MKTILACCLSLCLLLAALPAGAQNDVVNSAMRDELDRSMKTLQLEKLEKPYFIAYRPQEYTGAGAGRTCGSAKNGARAFGALSANAAGLQLHREPQCKQRGDPAD